MLLLLFAQLLQGNARLIVARFEHLLAAEVHDGFHRRTYSLFQSDSQLRIGQARRSTGLQPVRPAAIRAAGGRDGFPSAAQLAKLCYAAMPRSTSRVSAASSVLPDGPAFHHAQAQIASDEVELNGVGRTAEK